ncbi:MAG TPA: hypothetical protein VGM03_18670 [Phycisphaerae bacterium]|jgi:hypothetical protein
MITQTVDPENELTTTLYAQHQAALRAFVVRRKIPRAFQATHSPEDVTQHVWQEALPHLRAVYDSGQGGVLPYLLTIAWHHLGRMWGIVSKRRKRANREADCVRTEARTAVSVPATKPRQTLARWMNSWRLRAKLHSKRRWRSCRPTSGAPSG